MIGGVAEPHAEARTRAIAKLRALEAEAGVVPAACCSSCNPAPLLGELVDVAVRWNA